MRSIVTMALKDIRLITRDKMGMFFIIGFPIALALFMGAITTGIGSSKNTQIVIAIVDEDQSEMSAKLIETLEENKDLKVTRLDREEAVSQVRLGKLVAMIAIPKDYGEIAGLFWEEGPPLQIGVDPSRSAESSMLQGFIMQSVGELAFTRFQDPSQMKPLIAKARKEIAEDDDVPLLIRPIFSGVLGQLETLLDGIEQLNEDADGAGDGEGAGENGAVSSDGPSFEFVNIEQIDITRQSSNSLASKLRSRWDISFPQAMLWGVLGCCAGFAVTMVRERTQGTMIRLQVAPLRRFQILGGKALACFLTVICVICVLVALGVWLGMRPRSYPLLLLASLSLSICFVGVMMLMSVAGRSEESVSGAAWGANILMSMFGGGMVPLAFMPGFMRPISNFSPVRWGILAMEGAIWRGFSLQEMLLPCGILVGIGAVGVALGVYRLSRLVG